MNVPIFLPPVARAGFTPRPGDPILAGPVRPAAFRLPAYVAALLGGVALLAAVDTASAQNGTFSATPTSANFNDTGNWVGGVVPGATGTTTNTGVATFNATVTNGNGTTNPLLIDPNRNIFGITFDTASASAFTIGTTGGNALLLTSGGTIQTTSTVANTETVNAPLVLEPASSTTAGTYTFSSNAASAANVLNFGGAVSTGTTTGLITLTLNGTNTGANTLAGTFSDTGSGGLKISKSGTGTWTFANTGTSTLAKGQLDVSGGTFNFGVSGGAAPTLNINGNTGSGSGLTASGTSVFNMANGTLALSGISYTINFGGGGTQTFNQTGGTITSSGFTNFSANGGTSNINISGGALTSTNATGIELSVRGTTNAFLNGTGLVTAPVLNLRSSQLNAAGVNGTFDLGTGAGTGGTLLVGKIIPGTNTGTGSSIFNFNGGTLKSSAASTAFLAGLTTANVRNGGALINTNSFSDTIGQALLHSTVGGDSATDGGLTLNDTAATKGTLILTGTNTYTGATTISAGTLQLGTGATGNDGSITATSGVTDNAALAYNLFGTQTAGYVISGTGTVAKLGAGILDLTGANTYSGATTLNAGTLQIGNNAALGTSNSLVLGVSGVTVSSDSTTARSLGAVNITETLTTGQSYTFGDAANTGALTFGTFTLNGGTTVTNPSAVTFGLVGSGKNFTKSGAGNLTLTGANNLASNGSYTQTAGTTTLASGATLPTKLNLGGGTFDLNGQSISITGLAGTTGTITNNGNADAILTNLLTTSGGPFTYAGSITDGSTNKTALTFTNGGSTLASILTGSANTFTGGLTLAGAQQTVVVTSATNGAGNSTAANAISLGGGTLSLTNDGAGGTAPGTIIYGSTANTNGYNVTTTGTATVNVDSITTGGAVTNKTIQLNNLSIGGQTLNVTGNSTATGATGYALSFAGTTTLTTTAGGVTSTLNPTTANITLGAVMNAATAGTNTLALGGTSTGNAINGVISEATGGGLIINHNGASTWTIGGNVSSTLAKGQLVSSAGTLNFGNLATDTTSLTLNGQTSGGNVGVFVQGGTFNMKGGTITTSATGQGLVVQGANAVFNQTGGLINTTGSDFIEFANNGTTTQNISGGELRTGVRIELNTNGNSSATNLSGTGLVTAPRLVMLNDQNTNNNTSTSTFNLGNGTVGGGTLVTGIIAHGTSTGTGATTFNFNGGTLQASASSATFLQGITAANVQAGGAIINTAGFNDTVAQPLLTGTAQGTPDGGLTKNGAGTLTLTGANTYTGPTAVNAGTLLVNGNQSTAGGAVSVSGSGILGGTGTVGGAATIGTAGATGSNGIITGGTVGTVGTLALASTLTINGTYVADISGAASDQLTLAGILNISGGTLNLSGALNGTTTYVLATYASLAGMFGTTNVPANYTLTDTGTMLELVPNGVPEPGTWLGGLLVAGAFGYSQRRRLAGKGQAARGV